MRRCSHLDQLMGAHPQHRTRHRRRILDQEPIYNMVECPLASGGSVDQLGYEALVAGLEIGISEHLGQQHVGVCTLCFDADHSIDGDPAGICGHVSDEPIIRHQAGAVVPGGRNLSRSARCLHFEQFDSSLTCGY